MFIKKRGKAKAKAAEEQQHAGTFNYASPLHPSPSTSVGSPPQSAGVLGGSSTSAIGVGGGTASSIMPHNSSQKDVHHNSSHPPSSSTDPVLSSDSFDHRLGNYQLMESIGKGGYGMVYRGLNIERGITVAVKRIHLQGIPQQELEGIEMEIKLLQNLSHPNIVKYLDSIRSEEYLNIILEYVENGSLSSLLFKFGGSFPEQLCSHYITQVLRGLQYLHAQGVIHRDIKGANILSTKEGQVKLADFGVATKFNETRKSDSVVGCLAPETLLWLSDGSTIRADELESHHRLLGEDGKPVEIVKNSLIGTKKFPMPREEGWYCMQDNIPVRVPPFTPGSTLSGGWKIMRKIEADNVAFDSFTVSDNHLLTMVVGKKGTLPFTSPAQSSSQPADPSQPTCSFLPSCCSFTSYLSTPTVSPSQLEKSSSPLQLIDISVSNYEALSSPSLLAVKYSAPLIFQPESQWLSQVVNRMMGDLEAPMASGEGRRWERHEGGERLMARSAEITHALLHPSPENASIRSCMNWRAYTYPSSRTGHTTRAIFPPTATTMPEKFEEAVACVAQYIVQVSAWVLGLWLSTCDGPENVSSISLSSVGLRENEDCEGIIQRCRHWIDILGLSQQYQIVSSPSVSPQSSSSPKSLFFHPPYGHSEDDNPLRALLRNCEIETHPSSHLLSPSSCLSLQQSPVPLRLSLLSGFVDGCGYLDPKDETHHMRIKMKKEAEWVCEILRQTGFSTPRPVFHFSHQSWLLSPILADYDHSRRLLCACHQKRVMRRGMREKNPFLSNIRVSSPTPTPSFPSSFSPRPVVSFQVSSPSHRFLLADGTVTHNTPYWMAPEIIEMTGQQSSACDIWSLGCLLLELLTGKPPYFDLQQMPALFRIVQDEHPPLPDFISPALEDFLLQCFQKDPNRRIDANGLLKHPWLKKHVEQQEEVEEMQRKIMAKEGGNTTGKKSTIHQHSGGAGGKKLSSSIVSEDSEESDWDDSMEDVDLSHKLAKHGGAGTNNNKPTVSSSRSSTATTASSSTAGASSHLLPSKSVPQPVHGSDDEDWDGEEEIEDIEEEEEEEEEEKQTHQKRGVVPIRPKISAVSTAGKSSRKSNSHNTRMTVGSPAALDMDVGEEDGEGGEGPELVIKLRKTEEEGVDPFAEFSSEDNNDDTEEADDEEVVGKTSMKTIKPTPPITAAALAGATQQRPGHTVAPSVSSIGGSSQLISPPSSSTINSTSSHSSSFTLASALPKKLEAFIENDEEEMYEFNKLEQDLDKRSSRLQQTHPPHQHVKMNSFFVPNTSGGGPAGSLSPPFKPATLPSAITTPSLSPPSSLPSPPLSPNSAAAAAAAAGGAGASSVEDEVDPFDDIVLETADSNPEDVLLSKEFVRILEQLTPGNDEKSILDACDKLHELGLKNPETMRNLMTTHGVIPVMEILEINKNNTHVLGAILKLINQVIVRNIKYQQNISLVGLIPAIIRFGSSAYPSDIRMESASVMKQFCYSSDWTRKMFIACLDPATEVWLADGTTRRADELVPGDQLIGDDGQPVAIVPNTLIGTVGFPMPPAPGHYLPPVGGSLPALSPAPIPGVTTPSPGWRELRTIIPDDSGYDSFTVSDNHLLTVTAEDMARVKYHGLDADTIILEEYAVNAIEHMPDHARIKRGDLQQVKYSQPLVFNTAHTHWFRTQVNRAMMDAGLDGGADPLVFRADTIVHALLNPRLPASAPILAMMNEENYRDDVNPTQSIFPPLPLPVDPSAALTVMIDYLCELSSWVVGVWESDGDGVYGTMIRQSMQSQSGMENGIMNNHSGIFHRCRHWVDLLGLPHCYQLMPGQVDGGGAGASSPAHIVFHPPHHDYTDEYAQNILRCLLIRCQLVVPGAGVSAGVSDSHKHRLIDPTLPGRLGFQHAPPDTRLAFLAGLIDGGGWRDPKDDTHGFTTQCQGLAEWVCVLFRQGGFTTSRPSHSTHIKEDEISGVRWTLHPIISHFSHAHRLQCACEYKRTVNKGLRTLNPFTSSFHIVPPPAPAGTKSPLVSFQLANVSGRFLLADGTLTHNCDGLPVLVSFLEEKYTTTRKLIWNSIDCIRHVFEITTNPKNDFYRLFCKYGLLVPITNTLVDIQFDVMKDTNMNGGSGGNPSSSLPTTHPSSVQTMSTTKFHSLTVNELSQEYIFKICDILYMFSQGDKVVKDYFVKNPCVIQNIFKVLPHLKQESKILILKALKNISMASTTLDVLESAGAIPALIPFLDANQLSENQHQALVTMYYLCQIKPSRQEQAVLAGVIPSLQRIIRLDHPLKQFAYTMIFLFAKTSWRSREELKKYDGLQFYLDILSSTDIYWRNIALEIISYWLNQSTNDKERVVFLLNSPSNINKILRVFKETDNPVHFNQIVENLKKIVTASIRINQTLGRGKEFILEIRNRLLRHTSSNIIRTNLLRLLTLLLAAHPAPHRLARDADLLSVLYQMLSDKSAVIVGPLAQKVLQMCTEDSSSSTEENHQTTVM